MLKRFDWSRDKNQWLIRERGVSFEAVVAHIEEGGILAVVPGKGKFAHQKQFVLEMNRYIYVVPFIEEGDKVFLKTIIPSRKLTKIHLLGGSS